MILFVCVCVGGGWHVGGECHEHTPNCARTWKLGVCGVLTDVEHVEWNWDGGGGTGGQQSTELEEEMRLTVKSLGWARAERAGNLPRAKFYLLEPSSKKWVPYQEIRFVTYKRLCSPRLCRQGSPNKALASRSRSFTWTALPR